jgi:TonB family protein
MQTMKTLHAPLILVAFAIAFAGAAGCAHSTTSPRQTTASETVTTSRNYPDPDEFVQVDRLPDFSMNELSSRLHYPTEARRKNIEGRVVVQALIDTLGKVIRTQIAMSDNDLLTEAALSAVMSTSFTPAYRNGQPIAVWVSIPVTFKLK